MKLTQMLLLELLLVLLPLCFSKITAAFAVVTTVAAAEAAAPVGADCRRSALLGPLLHARGMVLVARDEARNRSGRPVADAG